MLSAELWLKELLTTRASQLGIVMGTRYMEATRSCLEGGFSEGLDGQQNEKEPLCASFKKLVIDRIAHIE